MPSKHLFEYALIRIVPRVEREEFANVGVLICCKQQNVLLCKIQNSFEKVLALDPQADLAMMQDYLDSFEKICKGENIENPISKQDAASRFRWLTAQRSSMLQTSRPHTGLTEDLQKTLESLFEAYVA